MGVSEGEIAGSDVAGNVDVGWFVAVSVEVASLDPVVDVAVAVVVAELETTICT